jgi:hypothetical protein
MDGIVLVMVHALMHGAINEPIAFTLEDKLNQVLVHEKNCSNSNTIDQQLQLDVSFVPHQGDQFNYFFRTFPTFSRRWCDFFFSIFCVQYPNY